MQKALLWKIATIFGLILLLLIPLALIQNKIHERASYKAEVKQSIAESWTGRQSFLGPVLVLPYIVQWEDKVWDPQAEQYQKVVKTGRENMYIFPQSMQLESQLETELRYKGIYKVPVYKNTVVAEGGFSTLEIKNRLRDITQINEFIKWEEPYISIALSDPRGIDKIPQLNWFNKRLDIKPGTKISFWQHGVHAPLSMNLYDEMNAHEKSIPFDLNLNLRGMETFGVLPLAKEMSVSIRSSWPHPSFYGAFLPSSRNVTSDGFSANWKITSFATDVNNKLLTCQNGNCLPFNELEFGVSLFEPVDVYAQSDRATKYGVLFIVFVFIAFFVFEMLNRLPLHPVQYALIGLAVAIFYLLLISLSEHIDFSLAYGISTVCCVSLMFGYFRTILKSLRVASYFSLSVLLVYGLLYLIIRSEDYALLMGALLCFSSLGVVMYSTRNINWDEVTAYRK
ncbi:cell envelope integrity protein CreD [Teredinibacter sp. KSP-S5-2]|uniref:cell envelope integrity protein CreD n=1 Tax=Teredinibacter sp. KSP-S5-2 TaxID=3034506 RepID=UPI002935183A|nr:cell envelope integrity protein CreD [Teredinibacter sp. KSP-S5-2]WNO10359.1 cell envelope integrity protein CreD [Teredinibacter sp. KSP-S5-2]